MPKQATKVESKKELQGWSDIASFLGLPVATAQRWQKSGMPVHRGGRYVYANPEELNLWLNRESPTRFSAHIATENEDLATDLKQSLANVRTKRKPGLRKLPESRPCRLSDSPHYKNSTGIPAGVPKHSFKAKGEGGSGLEKEFFFRRANRCAQFCAQYQPGWICTDEYGELRKPLNVLLNATQCFRFPFRACC